MPAANLRIHLVGLSTSEWIRPNSFSEILSSVSAAEILSAIELSFEMTRTWIWSCFLALASSFRQMNLPPAPSNPLAIAPACKPVATGVAIIVINSPTPMAAMTAPATESLVSSPSMTLAPPAGISYTAMLWSHAPFPGGLWPRPSAEVGDSLQSSRVVGKVPSCLTITAVG